MTKKIKKELCWECKKRVAKYECSCGLKICSKCYDEYGEGCPADEGIEHYIVKVDNKNLYEK